MFSTLLSSHLNILEKFKSTKKLCTHLIISLKSAVACIFNEECVGVCNLQSFAALSFSFTCSENDCSDVKLDYNLESFLV